VQTIRQPQALGAKEFRDLVEERVQRTFGMTLEDFAKAFKAGKLDGDPAAYSLAVIAGVTSG
jgi:hypothetical protein